LKALQEKGLKITDYKENIPKKESEVELISYNGRKHFPLLALAATLLAEHPLASASKNNIRSTTSTDNTPNAATNAKMTNVFCGVIILIISV
jgi:hypothetical protein